MGGFEALAWATLMVAYPAWFRRQRLIWFFQRTKILKKIFNDILKLI